MRANEVKAVFMLVQCAMRIISPKPFPSGLRAFALRYFCVHEKRAAAPPRLTLITKSMSGAASGVTGYRRKAIQKGNVFCTACANSAPNLPRRAE